jgi:uncharacterized protein (TIGR03435 family)
MMNLAIVPFSSSEWTAIGILLANHLWQSTLFAAVAGVLTLLLRKNRAHIRYWLWLTASLKFLLPFSLLVAIGNHLPSSKAAVLTQPGFTVVVQEIGQPFAPATLPSSSTAVITATHLVPNLVLGVWFTGFTGVLILWCLRWRRVNAALHRALPPESGRELEAQRRLERSAGVARKVKILASSSALEPGVIGIFRPVLVVPAGIADRLTNTQLEAILLHELCHVRRRDNLAAAIHMLVEATFWFHPLVWWIGARLVDERERACDEEVVRLGSDPEAYAEGILRVCQFYLESPLACVAGITGSNLKKRIEDIMSHHIARNLNIAKKLFLTMMGIAALVVPVLIGFLNPVSSTAQSQPSGGPDQRAQTFGHVSIKTSKAEQKGWWSHSYPDGRFVVRNASLKALIQTAYGINLVSIPDALTSERYDIDASAGAPAQQDALRLMLRAWLINRFKLESHVTTKEMPVYVLSVGTQGPKLRLVDAAADKCEVTIKAPGGEAHIVGQGTTKCLANVLTYMSQADPPSVDRPVLDNTGLKGVFDFDIAVDLADPSSFFPAMQQLGLKLEANTAPIETLVVDHAEQPDSATQSGPVLDKRAPDAEQPDSATQSGPVLGERAPDLEKLVNIAGTRLRAQAVTVGSHGFEDTKQCAPKQLVMNRFPFPGEPLRVRKGEQMVTNTPIFAIEILESGEVANARMENSSGIADLDTRALQQVHAMRYNKRPGCGIWEGKISLTYDF